MQSKLQNGRIFIIMEQMSIQRRVGIYKRKYSHIVFVLVNEYVQ
jgi:hypothetical protein